MDFEAERNQLVDRLLEREQLDTATEQAMRAVPRHEFVPEDRRDSAYKDSPLPIGEGQTISAPHMVAIMTDLLDLSDGDKVLEIGTGCGYHAAVTAEVVGASNVYTVEYHNRLATDARENLAGTGYDSIEVRHGDGRKGWQAYAPFDRAYLTCAADAIPARIVDQVRDDGILLAPIGSSSQVLYRARKQTDGTLDTERHGHVRFVPLK